MHITARRLVVPAFLVLVLGFAAWLLVPGTWLIAGGSVRRLEGEKQAAAINAVRTTLVVGFVAITGVFTYILNRQGYFLSRRGQLTERYSRAVTQLASANVFERLGGVYALEHVMRESEGDHETVVEVLAAFVRTEARVRPGSATSALREDIAAAMTVLARRPLRSEENRVDLRHTDLSGLELASGTNPRRPRLARANLCGARLTGAVLPNADLTDALLAGVDLTRADLKKANLSGAWLSDATLEDTHLEGAKLVAAKLDNATLTKTHFDRAILRDSWLNSATQNGAWFLGSDLTRAWLPDVNLEGSQGLTEKQLLDACLLPSTTLPQDLKDEPGLRERSNTCQDEPHRHLPDHPFPWPVNRAGRGASARRR